MEENLLQKIQQDLKQILSEKRYLHSIGTMKLAEELAKQYHVNPEEAALTGLAHDMAKELPKEERIKYIVLYCSCYPLKQKNLKLCKIR